MIMPVHRASRATSARMHHPRRDAFSVLAGFYHWITAGPNEVQPEDEAEAQRLLHSADGGP